MTVLEPRYKVGYVAKLLDCAPGTVRSLIEAGEFGPYEVGNSRGDLLVSQSGLTTFGHNHGLGGRLLWEPHFRATWVAEFLARRPVDVRSGVEGGSFGPDCLRLPGGELRIPLSGLQHYNSMRRVVPAHQRGGRHFG